VDPPEVSKLKLANEDQNEEDARVVPTTFVMHSTGSKRYRDMHNIVTLRRNVTLWSELALRFQPCSW
jgi:hypothetical protein